MGGGIMVYRALCSKFSEIFEEKFLMQISISHSDSKGGKTVRFTYTRCYTDSASILT